MSDRPDPCLHSMIEVDCAGCWYGVVVRQDAHVDRLRQMLVDAGGAASLQQHDAYWFGGNAKPLPERTVT